MRTYERSIAAAIILAGIALAVAWAIRLPMLVGQDESNHYDYVLSVASAGRLIPGREGRTGTDTHPSIAYLMRATNARGLRWGGSARVPPSYGSAGYFAQLDRAAPAFDRERYRRGPIDPVPYISKMYPLGYYALAAVPVAMAGDSVTRQFFAARLLSPLLFGIGLLFTWLTLVQLGVLRQARLAILFCCACFPLAGSVAGYVQPDNLVFTLIAIAVYCALRLEREPQRAPAAGLVVTLVWLCVTKQHFFAAVLLPIGAALACRPGNVRRRAPLIGLVCGIVILAAAATVWADGYRVAPPEHQAFCGPAQPRAEVSFGRTEVHGLGEHARLAAISFVHNLTGSYSFATFWFTYGAHDLIALPEDSLGAQLLHLAVQAGVIFTFLLIVLALYFNAKRLLRIGRERSPWTALAVLTHNVPVNAYLVYFVLLLLYAASSNVSIVSKGRYFFPLLPAAWLLALYSTRNAFSRPMGRRVTLGLQAAVAAYCIVMTIAAFRSIDERFYGPQPPPSAGDLYARFYAGNGRAPETAGLGPFATNDLVRLQGFALDTRTSLPPGAVLLSIDGGVPLRARPAANTEFACDNGDQTLAATGFLLTVPARQMGPGHHTVKLLAEPPWSPHPIDTGASAEFTIERS